MRNIKVIQHAHGKEHITDKLETKSLEFTCEFVGNFRRKDSSLTFDSRPPFHNWHDQHAIYLTRLKTQYFKFWRTDLKIMTKLEKSVFVCYNLAFNPKKCTKNKAHSLLLCKFSGIIPEVSHSTLTILSCRQNKTNIRGI
jgi:hypothetical protein